MSLFLPLTQLQRRENFWNPCSIYPIRTESSRKRRSFLLMSAQRAGRWLSVQQAKRYITLSCTLWWHREAGGEGQEVVWNAYSSKLAPSYQGPLNHSSVTLVVISCSEGVAYSLALKQWPADLSSLNFGWNASNISWHCTSRSQRTISLALQSLPLITPAWMRRWGAYLGVQELFGGLQEDKSLQQQLALPECFLHTCNSTGAAGPGSEIWEVINWTRWMAVKQYIHVPSSYT